MPHPRFYPEWLFSILLKSLHTYIIQDVYKRQESTWCNYRYTIKLLNKAFGHLRLTDVKTVQVNRFINELESSGYSASQISKCRSLLIQILDVAEADDLVAVSYTHLSSNINRPDLLSS